MQPLESPEPPPLAADEPPPDRPWIERVVTNPSVRSVYLSITLHLLIATLLSWLVLENRPPRRLRAIELAVGQPVRDELAGDPLASVEIGAAGEAAARNDAVAQRSAAGTAAGLPEPVAIAPAVVPVATDSAVEIADLATALETAAAGPVPPAVAGPVTRTVSRRGGGPPERAAADSASGDPFAARKASGRAAAARGRGGNASSEAAVERGLAWLALHQAVDGSWQFDLSGCRCNGACRDPGTLTSTTASTAIALLPFLGAGHTHLDGRYQETVSRGIYYLLSRMASTPRGGDCSEGTMYGHGVTTLVLTEALGMTKDETLVRPVRDALRFIETSQDLHGGGWRYLPGQAGDITVTAWQLAALKSGQLAGLEPPSPTIDGIRRFLDRVQTRQGEAYGYRSPAAKPCTSAIGLLCRLYTGWPSDHEALQRGLTALAKPGPAPTAIYQNFYLSQALLQSGHPVWPRWNAKNRDQLVALQARQAHEAGSWFVADHDTAPGGRLAHTCLAILTLEVYYRLLPIYRQEAVDTAF